MTKREILENTDHRPWRIPEGSWKFYQEWNNAVFLHYDVDVNQLKHFVPDELEIDLFDGKAWVSVVVFTMERIRPKNLPSFSTISNFEEINIRTYVKANIKSGVYFLSIEGGKRLSCMIAKQLSELPYRYSSIKRTTRGCDSHNTQFNDKLHLEFEVGKELNHKSDLDTWLTERYALFQDAGESINEFEIHHIEWPVKEIDVTSLELKYPRFESLLNNKPRLMHYSDGVKVLAWGKTKMSKADL